MRTGRGATKTCFGETSLGFSLPLSGSDSVPSLCGSESSSSSSKSRSIGIAAGGQVATTIGISKTTLFALQAVPVEWLRLMLMRT